MLGGKISLIDGECYVEQVVDVDYRFAEFNLAERIHERNAFVIDYLVTLGDFHPQGGQQFP